MGFLRLLWAALREIFDERAYERYLVRNGTSRSRESYRSFCEERDLSATHKPRCC